MRTGGGANGVGGDGQGDLLFVSYSHSDREWVDRLLVLLTPLVESQRIKVWADRYMPVGEDWQREVEGAMARAKFALLLVSADFLASSFIMDRELPALTAQ